MISFPQHPEPTFTIVQAKGAGLWLIARPPIRLFHITHFTFTSTLHFCFGLIQPSTFSLFMCECGHGLDAFGMHLACCMFRGQWIATHETIRDIRYVLARKNGHIVRREQWYALMSKISLSVNIYMTCEDWVFVANVMIIDPTWETMIMNVISRATSVVVELNAIVKIRKYRRLHEEHHFIPMAMDVHITPERDMDRFIRECACLFHNRRSRGHLSLFLHSII
jgi:hypothetical protein